MSPSHWPKGAPPEYRDVSVAALLVCLRAVLGVWPDQITPGELAALRGRPLPERVFDVDAGALLAWTVAGLILFSERGSPSWRKVAREAKRVLLALNMERTGGNITRVAEALDSSRRMVRDTLKATGLYTLDLEGDAEPAEVGMTIPEEPL